MIFDYSLPKEPYHVYVGIQKFPYKIKDKMYKWVMVYRPQVVWMGDIIMFTDPKDLIAFKLKFGV